MPALVKIRIAGAEPLRRGKDFLWSVMRELHASGQPFTIGDVWKRSDDPHRAAVGHYIRRLETAGFVERTGEIRLEIDGRNHQPLFRVARPQSATPVVSRAGAESQFGLRQQNMWNVMRRERDGFTAKELAILASTDDVKVAVRTASCYCRRLEGAGILGSKRGSGTACRWWLKGSGNTGPKPPIIVQAKLVFDQNTSRIVGEIIAVESRA